MANRAGEGAVIVAFHGDLLLPGEHEAPLAGGTLPSTAQERRYPLADEACVIGRDPDRCQLRVRRERTDVSRVHATIKRQGAHYLLEDLGRHGTFVNGHRVEGFWELRSGDVVGLAKSPEMFVFEDPAQPAQPPAEPLTERERDVLRLVAMGKSNLEIAAALHIAVDTVKTRLKSIFQKLQVDNRTEAVHAAQRLHML